MSGKIERKDVLLGVRGSRDIHRIEIFRDDGILMCRCGWERMYEFNYQAPDMAEAHYAQFTETERPPSDSSFSFRHLLVKNK